MGGNIKGSFKMIRDMDKGYLNGEMGECIEGNGRMENSME
jgi:hypothetical protein